MFETGKISVMKSSTQVLVKVALFQLWGRDHPQGDASLNLFLESKGFLLGLSNEVSNFFLLQVFQKLGMGGQKSSKFCLRSY